MLDSEEQLVEARNEIQRIEQAGQLLFHTLR
jgi:hypothetical protein